MHSPNASILTLFLVFFGRVDGDVDLERGDGTIPAIAAAPSLIVDSVNCNERVCNYLS